MSDSSAEVLKQAKELFESGALSEAEGLLRAAEEEGSGDAVALNFRAYLLYKMGRTVEAAEAYRRLSDLSPSEPSHHLNLGLIYFKQDRIREARDAFERVLELSPGERRALRNLGFCYKRLGEAGKAAACFRGAEEKGEKKGAPAPSPARKPPVRTDSPSRQSALDIGEWMAAAALPPPGSRPEIRRSGPGTMVCTIDEKIYLNRRYLISQRGVIVFSSSSREAGRAGRKFGDSRYEFIRAEGNGEIVFGGGGRNLNLFRMAEGSRVNVNFPALVCCGPEMDMKFDFRQVSRRLFLPVELEGEELFVLALRGTATVLSVQPDLPAVVRTDAVTAWTEGLDFEQEPGPLLSRFPGRGGAPGVLRFDGEGLLLLQEP